MPRKWPQEHDEELRRLHGEGLSFAEIAGRLSAKCKFYYTRNACIGRALRIGLTRNMRELLRDRTRAAIRREEVKRLKRGESAPHEPPARRQRRRYKVAELDVVPQEAREVTVLPPVKRSTVPAGSTASRVMTAIRKEPPREKDARPLRCIEIEPKHLSIMDLTETTCRWPFGGWPEASPITFCGHWCPKEVPYCFDHQRLSIGAGTPSERAAHRVMPKEDAA